MGSREALERRECWYESPVARAPDLRLPRSSDRGKHGFAQHAFGTSPYSSATLPPDLSAGAQPHARVPGRSAHIRSGTDSHGADARQTARSVIVPLQPNRPLPRHAGSALERSRLTRRRQPRPQLIPVAAFHRPLDVGLLERKEDASSTRNEASTSPATKHRNRRPYAHAMDCTR
jgi:hypothetical protein